MLSLILLLLSGALVFLYYRWPELVRYKLRLPAFRSRCIEKRRVHVEMDDGVKLVTNIYLPENYETRPLILLRDPYFILGKLFANVFVRFGYVCVSQDVRGRFNSEGEFYPFVNEREDGLCTLKWLAEQDFYNGDIATMGDSYLGIVSWSWLDKSPANVKTVIASISHGDVYQLSHRNGIYINGLLSYWAAELLKGTHELYKLNPINSLIKFKLFNHEPNKNKLASDLGWFNDYLSHPEPDADYWHTERYQNLRNAYKTAKVPMLLEGGWHDFFLEGQIDVFESLPKRDDSAFVIRHGGHTGQIGAVGFSVFKALGFTIGARLRWLDEYLLEDKNPNQNPDSNLSPGYWLQDMKGNWAHHEKWAGGKESETLYLGNLDKAAQNAGKLLPKNERGPDDISPASYFYDPKKPLASEGGECFLKPHEVAVVEQSNKALERDDVLIFDSESYTDGLNISGAIKLKLSVSSDAKDTAFSVKLIELKNDGTAVNIRNDISSLKLRNGATRFLDYTPNERVNLEYSLIPIEWQLSAGSKLRLLISSSDYPMYGLHNNIDSNWLASHSIIAKQNIYSGELSIPRV